jgi:NADPH:quinone reductase-like Zn-dependent oxidoreductase
MRSLAVSFTDVLLNLLPHDSVECFEIDGVPLACGILRESPPDFDDKAEENRLNVLVKKQAFSCNYRDKGLMFFGLKLKRKYKHGYVVVGSEFAGEVIAVGADVTSFKVGDRVMGDNHYTGAGDTGEGYKIGVPASTASKEYQVFHQAKLIKVPAEMPDEVAAAFSVDAQTAYSAVRKLNISSGASVLVMDVRSNTSLFAISALKKRGVNVYATAAPGGDNPRILGMGVKELFVMDRASGPASQEALRSCAREIGGFNGVIDPAFDLHLGSVMSFLATGGRYVTFGSYDQYAELTGRELTPDIPDVRRVLWEALLKNVHIIGTCLGLTSDLQQAIEDYRTGDLEVIIDSVYAGQQPADFLCRTFSAADRFGKVVYRYL